MDQDRISAELAERRARGVRTGIYIAVVVVVLRYLPVTSELLFFSLIDHTAQDGAFVLRGAQPPGDIAIIAIDDLSLRADRLGQFPWPRETYGRLLEKLPGAKVVAFDVLFTEPDRTGPASDAAFAAAIREHGRVVLAMHRQAEVALDGESGGEPSDLLRGYTVPAEAAMRIAPMAADTLNPVTLAPPVPVLAEAAAGIGYVDISPDSDGVYRRVRPLWVGTDGRAYPHFSVEAARVASGAQPGDMTRELTRGRLTIAEHRANLDGQGRMLINYCGPHGTIPTYSFWDVLQGAVSPDEFKDKIVFVGASAPGLYDIRSGPYWTQRRFFLGVETNANIVNSLLRMPALTDGSQSLGWILFAILLGAVAGWVVWTGRESSGPTIGAGLVLLVALPSFFVAFYTIAHVSPYSAVLLATAVPVALGAYERLGAEKRMIRQQFSTYVSPAVLEVLMRNPEILRTGTRREMTLLFSDVRGSTTLSEKAVPEEWLAQLNEYMSQMTTAIFDYDGFLDKFIGDGIMAIWNAFGTQEHHAALATMAGLEMLRRLDELNALWAQDEHRVPFRIGIGLHTGEAMVGDAGSDQRRQFTAIGDAVNTASRVESMNKELGTAFIISETTAARVESLFELREIGEVDVRGRSEGVRVFEVLGEKSTANLSQMG